MAVKKIGRYKVEHMLGRGGMAVVYLADDPVTKRQVAIKVLSQSLSDEPEFQARFRREAETIARLEHGSIVPIYDFGEYEDQPYIVMRYMSGGTLLTHLAKGPLPLPELALIINRIADALDAAHAQNIIHRDLKPGNILFDKHNQAYLSDFGIAKIAEASAAYTKSGIIGTPAYMSPEQANGEELDKRSDIYSLGTMLFYMLTGQTPYQADTPIALAMKHLMEPIPNILTIKPDLPPDCDIIINQAMAKNRDNRYNTVGQLANDIAAIAKGQPVTPSVKIAKEEKNAFKKQAHVSTKNNKKPNQSNVSDKKSPYPWARLAVAGFIILILLLLGIFMLESFNNRQATSVEDNKIVNVTVIVTETLSIEPSPTLANTSSSDVSSSATPSPTAQPLMAAIVDSEAAQLFTMPNDEAEVLTTLNVGANLALLKRNAQGNWLKVQNVQGLSGWIKTNEVKVFMPILDIPVIEASATPTVEATFTNTATAIPVAIKTNTPVPSPTVSLLPQSPSQASDLLLGPILLEPENNASFNLPSIPIISWKPLKPTLAEDEFYLITIYRKQGENNWPDKAWTQETSWSFNEHYYLLDLSTDGRFVWSVKLLRKTGESEKGVPTGPDLSYSSEERILFWQKAQPRVPDSVKSSPVN